MRTHWLLCYNTNYYTYWDYKSKPLDACKAWPLRPREKNNKRKLILQYPTVWYGLGAYLKPSSRGPRDKLTFRHY